MTETQVSEKNELLGYLDRLKSLALSENFETVLDEAEDLRQKLSADRFEVVVLGQFKRGKSSLINALIGSDVMPVGSVPLTSVMTLVRYSPQPQAKVLFRKKDPLDIPPDQLSLFITEKGNPKNQKGVARVEVGVDSPFLAAGDVLVDTPGVGSTHAHNTQAAYETLPRADAVLYILSVDPPIGEEDLKFLVSIRQHVSKIFFVLNKRDYLPDREFEENMAFTEQVLKDTLQVGSVSLFAVSARWARDGRDNSDNEVSKKSGIAELEAHLQEFLRTGKGRQVLVRTAVRAEEAARNALALVEVEHHAYMTDTLQLETKAWSLSSYINNVFMEGAVAKRRLKAAHEAYKKMVRRAAADFSKAAAKGFAYELAMAAGGSSRVAAEDLAYQLSLLYAKKGKEILSGFFREKEVFLSHSFEKVRSDYEGRVLQQLDGVWKTAADLFGRLPAIESAPPESVRVPSAFFEPGIKFSPKLAKELASGTGRRSGASPALKNLERKVAADLLKTAMRVADEFLETCDAALKESMAGLERLSRQAHELSDRAVKVVVQRQTANEAQILERLANVRQRLTAAQGLFNDISAFRKRQAEQK